MVSIAAASVAAVVLSAMLQMYLQRRTSHGPVGLCPDMLPPSNPEHNRGPDRAVVVETSGLGTIRSELCRSFSETYHEARDRFLRAASDAGAEVASIEVVPGYHMDVAVLRGSSRLESGGGLAVHTSGLHGVEGYAGSAVQVAALRHLSSPAARAKLVPALVMVHAVNPYGMAHYRRTNENNVDLNRNALDEDEWAEMLKRDPNVVGYDDFDRAFFNPPHAPTFWGATIAIWIKSIVAIARNGFVKMKRSMVAGQYHNPHGIFYGGQELEASHRLLRDFLRKGGFLDANGTVTWVDVHTGLGPSGIDTLLEHSEQEDLSRWFPDAPQPIQDFKGENVGDVQAGYDMTRGTLNNFYERLFALSQMAADAKGPAGKAPLVMTQEFGTVPGVMVARALVLENMAYHHAPPEAHARWSELLRDAFYVRTNTWRRNVLRRGLIVLSQAVIRSSA